MYVTRPLSMYRRDPKSLSLPPPEGPNSGYLVIFDDECETYTCFGLCEQDFVQELPFPQNKILAVDEGDSYVEALFIPALNQPLSSNRYYAMAMQRGKHQGEAYTSSKEEDMSPGCFGGSNVEDVKPRRLDPSNTYQQVEILQKKDSSASFSAKSVAPDGFPPYLLRQKWWSVQMKTPRYRLLDNARGLDSSLRGRLPPLGTREVVGKWYCPFMFVVEQGMKLKEQMKISMFYEVTLEQRWEKIFECDNAAGRDNGDQQTVLVDMAVETEDVRVAGRRAVRDEGGAERLVYFKSCEHVEKEVRVGLSMEVVERMKWEQVRVGWVSGDCDQGRVRVERVEEFEGIWTKFECYVLVESFVLKRMDSMTVVLTYDFKHTHQIRCKWE